MVTNQTTRVAPSDEMRRTILSLIAKSRSPIGQGNLSLLLRKKGYSVSVPTIGRRLQEMEFEGLLKKASVDGRVITPRGRETLLTWETQNRLRRHGDALIDLLKRGDKQHIVDLLTARRIIEGETAALAARNASPESIQKMEQLLDEQAVNVAAGQLGVVEDAALHREIALASGNSVLYSIVSVLRSHQRYDFDVVPTLFTIHGARLVEDHRSILDAIRQHDPEQARAAMDEHLRKLTDDIERYWRRSEKHKTR
jgi:GntR family transcriptional repressor for pyruvate dehydrogenase complex